MPHLEQSSKLDLLRYVAKWGALATVVATLAGSASALFLFALDWATQTREANRWLIWGLPVAGFCVGWLYLKFGQRVEAGNNLLIDEIHDPQKVVPLRMAPLVLGGTVISHLFGASVGREGTAVQMGGALADQLTHLFRLGHVDRRMVLMAGISAGFASVFGTPLAGAVFALEVLAIGRMRLDALLPCVIAAVVMWGSFDRYIGLGIPVMVEAFAHPLAPTDFLGKMVFTIASLGSGFKGGEVTPLFYIGATLGNALAPLLDVPFALLAAVGFVAVFAGAANTPIASTLMAMELFGAEIGVFAALACVMSYVCSGHSGIYRAQRVAHRKTDAPSQPS